MRLKTTLFISYASEDRELAKGIALGLRNHKYKVFLDESDLPVGQEYDQRIEAAIKKSDGMIFIASEHSLTPGRYTLTELRFAEETWKTPAGKLLTVLIGDKNTNQLPAYLQAVTVLTTKGNTKAEVLSKARKIWPAINIKYTTLVITIASFAIVLYILFTKPLNNLLSNKPFDATQTSVDSKPNSSILWKETFRLDKITNQFGSSGLSSDDVAYSPYNNIILLGVTGGIFHYNVDRQKGKFIAIEEAKGNSIRQLIPYADEQSLALTGSKKLINIKSDTNVSVFPGGDKNIHSFALAQTVGLVAILGGDADVFTANLRTGESRLHMGGLPFQPGTLWFSKTAISDSGLHIAIGRNDGALFLYDTERSDEGPHQLSEPDSDGVAEIAISSDGRRLAAVWRAGRLAVWDLLSRSSIFDHHWTDRAFSSVTISKDGKRVIAAGYQLDRTGLVMEITPESGNISENKGGGPITGLTLNFANTEVIIAGTNPPLRILALP